MGSKLYQILKTVTQNLPQRKCHKKYLAKCQVSGKSPIFLLYFLNFGRGISLFLKRVAQNCHKLGTGLHEKNLRTSRKTFVSGLKLLRKHTMVIKVGGSLMTLITPAKPPKGVTTCGFPRWSSPIQLSTPANSWLKLQQIVGNWHLPFVASKQIEPPVLV